MKKLSSLLFQILKLTNGGFDIFKKYGIVPFQRKDIFYYPKKNNWEPLLNVFYYLRYFHNLSLRNVCAKIIHELGLNLVISEQDELELNASPLNSPILLFKSSIKWYGYAANYWKNYGFRSGEILKKYEIRFFIYYVYWSEKRAEWIRIFSKKEDPIFAYPVSEICYKIYRPYNTSGFKHLYWGQKDADKPFVFGISQLSKKCPFIIITKSPKDVMVIRLLQMDAICLNSETAYPQKETLDILFRKVEDKKDVIIFYDNDNTGKESSLEIAERCGISRIHDFLPMDLFFDNGTRVKDISDYIRYHLQNESKTIEEIKGELEAKVSQIIGKSIKNESISSTDNEDFVFDDEPIKNNMDSDGHNTSSAENNDEDNPDDDNPKNTPPYSNTEISNNQEDKTFNDKPEIPRIRTANQRLLDAEYQPELNPLCGSLFKQSQIAICFGDAGIGKTIFGYSLADDLSKGNDIALGLPSYGSPVRVLYYDLELSDKQFQNRYKGHHFSDSLYIATKLSLGEHETINIETFEYDYLKIKPHIIIIDNITYLSSGVTTETEVALKVMKNLKDIRNEYGVSILIFAHIPKIKSNSYIELNHLGYSEQSRPPIPQQTVPPKMIVPLKLYLCYFSLLQI